MILKIKKVNNDAKVPAFANPTDAGMDLFAVEDTRINPGQLVAVRTGLSMHIPEGYVGLIWDKSGIAIKNGLKTMGGVIDSGYRGEVLIGIKNLSEKSYTFEKGHKVAQMLIQKIETPQIVEVAELDSSDRAQGGFGSTGK